MCAWASVRACGWSMEIRNAAWGAVPFECQRQLPRILDASSSVLNVPGYGSVAGERGGAWVIGDGGRFCVWGTSDRMSGHYA